MRNTVRDPFWDTVKGVGYLCVLMGHMDMTRYIFNFHMPLFFMVSGMFFTVSVGGGNLMKIFKNILIPWIYFFAICTAITLVIGGGVNLFALIKTSYMGRPCVCNSLWFLTCLAGVQFLAGGIFPKITNRKREAVLIFVCLGLAFISSSLPGRWQVRFPLMMLSIPMAMLFFYVGYAYKDKIRLMMSDLKTATCLIALVSLGAVYWVISHYGGYSNMMYPIFNSISGFVIAALLGTSCVVLLVKLISRERHILQALAWVGRCSICFFLIEEYSIRLAHRILSGCNESIRYPIYYWESNWETLPWKMLVAISAFAISCAVMPFLMYGLNSLKHLIKEK